jgi:hypothetical protein
MEQDVAIEDYFQEEQEVTPVKNQEEEKKDDAPQ